MVKKKSSTDIVVISPEVCEGDLRIPRWQAEEAGMPYLEEWEMDEYLEEGAERHVASEVILSPAFIGGILGGLTVHIGVALVKTISRKLRRK